MTVRELALVSFTLLMQTSVGIVLVVAALPSLQGSQPKPGGLWPLIGRLDTPLGVAAAAAALGLLASLLHLGQPILAWLALANVRGSWLSREIALAIVFVVALAALALTHAGDRSAPSLRVAASALAAVVGLALVFAMARLYMIGGQPAWDRFTTPATFFASTLLLGLVVVVALGAPPLSPRAARVLASTAVALLAVQVLLVPALLAGVPSEPAAALGPGVGRTRGDVARGGAHRRRHRRRGAARHLAARRFRGSRPDAHARRSADPRGRVRDLRPRAVLRIERTDRAGVRHGAWEVRRPGPICIVLSRLLARPSVEVL